MQRVDCCPWATFTHKQIITGERSVPLPLVLATYVILADSFSGWKLTTYCALAADSESFDGSKLDIHSYCILAGSFSGSKTKGS